MDKDEQEKIVQAGQIAKIVVDYAKSIIKKDMPLLQIVDKIDDKILELKAKPAFPVNLSINEIAAHSTPAFNDTTLAHGLLKVDIGVHVDGFIADTAFSLDLEDSEENKRLIKAAEDAVNEATKLIKIGTELRQLGSAIEKAIKSASAQPIQNLSGHAIAQYDLHAGITIPNFDNNQTIKIEEGLYAIEPFATNGFGSVKDGKPSGIYRIEKLTNVRDAFAREVLEYISEEYQTLPFCSRWSYKKFGSRGLLALRRIEEAGILHHYPQLIEQGKGIVAQAEHSVLLTKDKKIITTL